jgi:hypothetical protein
MACRGVTGRGYGIAAQGVRRRNTRQGNAMQHGNEDGMGDRWRGTEVGFLVEDGVVQCNANTLDGKIVVATKLRCALLPE